MTLALSMVMAGPAPCVAIAAAIQRGRDLDDVQLEHVDTCMTCTERLAERTLELWLTACCADDISTRAAAGVLYWHESPVRAWRLATGQWRSGDDSPGDPWPVRAPSAVGRFVRRAWKLDREEVKQGAPITRSIANFFALVLGEIVRTDGRQVSRDLVIGAIVRGRPVAGRIRAEDLNHASRWIPAVLGATAYVYPGQQQALLESMRLLSAPWRRRAYAHTGFVEVDGRLAYLHAGGAIGLDDDQVTVELDEPSKRAGLASPSSDEHVRAAVLTSLKLLDCGAPSLMIPLIAMTYAAPVASLLQLDFGLFIVGKTGRMKSTRAALAQAHFGLFGDRLPVEWSSTEHAIESVLHTMKDMLVVVDDFAPNADKVNRRELVRTAQRIIRNIGNRSTRSRLGKDLRKRPDRSPRAAVVTTGEDLPPGASIVARLYVVEADEPEPFLSAITEVQRNAHQLPVAMYAYVAYVIDQWIRLSSSVLARRQAFRDQLQGLGGHRRHAGNVAALLVAMEEFADFVEQVGALTRDEANDLKRRAWETLTAAPSPVSNVDANVSAPGEDIALWYLDGVRKLVTAQQVRVLSLDDARACRTPPPDVIGYRDDSHVYLLPEPAHACVAATCTDRLMPSPKVIGVAMRNAGFLSCDGDNRPQARVSTPWGRDRVYRIRMEIWTGPTGPAVSRRPAEELEGAGPDGPDRIA